MSRTNVGTSLRIVKIIFHRGGGGVTAKQAREKWGRKGLRRVNDRTRSCRWEGGAEHLLSLPQARCGECILIVKVLRPEFTLGEALVRTPFSFLSPTTTTTSQQQHERRKKKHREICFFPLALRAFLPANEPPRTYYMYIIILRRDHFPKPRPMLLFFSVSARVVPRAG